MDDWKLNAWAAVRLEKGYRTFVLLFTALPMQCCNFTNSARKRIFAIIIWKFSGRKEAGKEATASAREPVYVYEISKLTTLVYEC